MITELELKIVEKLVIEKPVHPPDFPTIKKRYFLFFTEKVDNRIAMIFKSNLVFYVSLISKVCLRASIKALLKVLSFSMSRGRLRNFQNFIFLRASKTNLKFAKIEISI